MEDTDGAKYDIKLEGKRHKRQSPQNLRNDGLDEYRARPGSTKPGL